MPLLHRVSSAKRGYGADWQRLRRVVLQDEPLCRLCDQVGLTVLATEVDHIEPIEQRPDLRLVRSNLRPLCKPCHSTRTGRGNIDPDQGCDASGWPADLRHFWNGIG